jgi:hypothetical protein
MHGNIESMEEYNQYAGMLLYVQELDRRKKIRQY